MSVSSPHPKFSEAFEAIFNDTPPDIINAFGVEGLPQLDPANRQLVTWLTLPFARVAIEDLVWAPMAQEAKQEGTTLTPYTRLQSTLEDNIVTTRTRTMTGTIMPAFFHVLFTPEDSHSVGVLIPSASDRFRHSVGRLKLTTQAHRKPPTDDELRVGEIKSTTSSFRIDKETTKRAKRTSLAIPGHERVYPQAESPTDLPIKSGSVSSNKRVRGGGLGGTSVSSS